MCSYKRLLVGLVCYWVSPTVANGSTMRSFYNASSPGYPVRVCKENAKKKINAQDGPQFNIKQAL